MSRILLTSLILLGLTGGPAPAENQEEAPPVARVVFLDDKDQPHEATGRLLVEAEDGGVLLQEPDGRLWSIDKPQIQSRTAVETPFAPLTPEQAGEKIQDELGRGFSVLTTKHYVLVYNTSKPYAQWTGELFERLYGAFHNYWKQRGVKLTEPEFPLISLVFSTPEQFAEFATKDAGAEAQGAKGYYHIGTNRIVLYDLTGGGAGDFIRRLNANPYNVATIVHEATHQIAFNSGLHTRYADNPLWLTEGMAMYFESPDLTSKSGWKTIGAVNRLRTGTFREYVLQRRPARSLATLLEVDTRLANVDTLPDSYAEAWALTYFLIRTRKAQYGKYLELIATKPLLTWDKPEIRLADFKACFGDDLDKLEAEWLRYMQKVR